jgi:REase_DpnII-MboI
VTDEGEEFELGEAIPLTPKAAEKVTFHAFGHEWIDYPAGLAEDLIDLEREGAVFSHFADPGSEKPDGTCTFSYYRISLKPDEIFQFVEASIAYQEFQQATINGAGFEEALAAISKPEIAERVRSYGNYGHSSIPGGTVDIRGCHASFYPDGMEELLCGGIRSRYEALPELEPTRDRFGLLMQILNTFSIVSGQLEKRGRGRPPFEIENEYDLQDLLFAILRSVFEDARREEWTPQRAGSAKRIDIVVPSINSVIETKFLRNASHAKAVANELRIDFECYHDHENCGQLVALCMDPGRHLLDPEQFESDLSGLRQKSGHEFNVTVLVR